MHMISLLSQWKLYLDEPLQHEDGQSFSGKKLNPVVFEKVCRTVNVHITLFACFGTLIDDK